VKREKPALAPLLSSTGPVPYTAKLVPFRWIAPLAAVVALGAPLSARASPPLPSETVLVRESASGAERDPDLTSEDVPDAELRWLSLMSSRLTVEDPTGRPAIVRGDIDRGSGLILGQWEVVPSLANVVGSLWGEGMLLCEVVRDRQTRHRHRVRAFFRRRGVMLVWRISF
jgi:hypothetical protein